MQCMSYSKDRLASTDRMGLALFVLFTRFFSRQLLDLGNGQMFVCRPGTPGIHLFPGHTSLTV